MRIELQEEKKEETTEVKEPELKDKHESDLTKKEKRELERQKLKSMNFWGKLQYIWAYYKAPIFGLIGVIVILSVIKDAYDNSKINTALAITVIDSLGSDYETVQKDVETVLGVDEDEYQVVSLEQNLNTTEGGQELNPYGQMALVTKIEAKAIDVMVMPENYYESLDVSGYFAEIKEVLGEETYASFGSDADSYHVTVSSEEFAEKFGIPYDPVCIAVLANSENKENAAKWISSLTDGK